MRIAATCALVSASHHEPRSLLGYHEFARQDDTPLCMVRVLEPGADSVAVFWEDEPAQMHELKRVHDAGLFEGGIPFRRPESLGYDGHRPAASLGPLGRIEEPRAPDPGQLVRGSGRTWGQRVGRPSGQQEPGFPHARELVGGLRGAAA